MKELVINATLLKLALIRKAAYICVTYIDMTYIYIPVHVYPIPVLAFFQQSQKRFISYQSAQSCSVRAHKVAHTPFGSKEMQDPCPFQCVTYYPLHLALAQLYAMQIFHYFGGFAQQHFAFHKLYQIKRWWYNVFGTQIHFHNFQHNGRFQQSTGGRSLQWVLRHATLV